MDAGDIEENRTNEKQTQDPSTGQDKEHATEDFKSLDNGKIARSVHEADEALRSGSTLRRQEVEPEVEAEGDEGKTKEERSDAGEFFHSPDRLA